MLKTLQKIYTTYYNLLIPQDLWRGHYQILSIIFLKEFIKFNVNMDMMIKLAETCRITHKVCNCFLEYTNFKDDLIEYNCLCSNKNYQQKFDEKIKEQFFNTYKFSNHDITSLFYCCKKMFILMNIWIIGENPMKHHYLTNKIFIVT